MPTIDKLLIANRGEIALRVMRTCHAMGIATVAVYSEADAGAPFVAAADEAVCLGGAAARDSYLVIEKLLAAARLTGAQAIHPGYGFLSENPRFPEACAAAGVIFVGPTADTIRKLGAKREAKLLAAAAGVPVVPGYGGEDQAVAAFVAKADGVGYPLLLKASAGGGGKGMHVVRGKDGVAEAVERAKREAMASFGDDTLLMERYVERPRHVEVQILGDQHGNLIHLHERECSIQRRHQKILEEAPSPTLSDDTRARMAEAAVALGKVVGYTSAGTVEFIVDPEGRFYFLEVNTRLQVEHPVTELICGVDLVAEQLRIARGEPLRFSSPPPRHGHAIEVRLCAEDPARDFLPTTGTLVELAFADGAGATAVRCDLGVVPGSEIGIHYDSMLGKLIAHADTRAEAAAKLRRALTHGLVAGLPTNADLLARLLAHPAFLAAELDTHFLERHAESLLGAAADAATPALIDAAVAATLVDLAERRAARPLPSVALGWRNVPVAPATLRYRAGEQTIELSYQLRGDDEVTITAGGQRFAVRDYRITGEQGRGGLWVEAMFAALPEGSEASIDAPRALAGHRRRWRVARGNGRTWVAARGRTVALALEPRFPERVAAAAAGSLLAPMPGKVVKVLVATGDSVVAGAPIAILEAMKMEHTIRAAVAGTVAELRVAAGAQVAADELLAVVSPAALS